MAMGVDMKICQKAIVCKHERSGLFFLTLQDNPDHRIMARPSGKMEKRNIALSCGDLVEVELSPYDLTRGRIIWRY